MGVVRVQLSPEDAVRDAGLGRGTCHATQRAVGRDASDTSDEAFKLYCSCITVVRVYGRGLVAWLVLRRQEGVEHAIDVLCGEQVQQRPARVLATTPEDALTATSDTCTTDGETHAVGPRGSAAVASAYQQVEDFEGFLGHIRSLASLHSLRADSDSG